MKKNMQWAVLPLLTVFVLALSAGCARNVDSSNAKKMEDEKMEKSDKGTSSDSDMKGDEGKSSKDSMSSSMGSAPANLSIGDGAISSSVTNLTPDAPGTSFKSDVNQVFCFTRVLGAEEPTTIWHVWEYNNETVAKVELAVKSASYRTYSSKIIEAGQTGDWKCSVKDANGNLLTELKFAITE